MNPIDFNTYGSLTADFLICLGDVAFFLKVYFPSAPADLLILEVGIYKPEATLALTSGGRLILIVSIPTSS